MKSAVAAAAAANALLAASNPANPPQWHQALDFCKYRSGL